MGRAAGAVVVSLQAAKVESVQRTVDVVGTLFADEEPVVAGKVAGRCAAVFKDAGDRVRGDEPLAQISTVDFELARTQKELAAREPLARLGLRELPGPDFDPANVPTVRRARLQADNAESKYNRGKQLHDQKPPLLSDQDFADLKTAWEVAQSNYQVEMLTAQSALAMGRALAADLEIARQRLADATIRVPTVAGQPRAYAVAARMVAVGEYVKEGQAVYRLIDDDLLKLRANVPERFSREVAIGQEVRVYVEAFDKPFSGRVMRINPQVDAANRTFQVEVHIPNPKHVLKPGSFARGEILTVVQPEVVFVPNEAVISFAGTHKVYTVAGEKAVENVIEVGKPRGAMIEVARGLDGRSAVVVEGATKLAAGVAVRVKNTPTTQRALASAAEESR